MARRALEAKKMTKAEQSRITRSGARRLGDEYQDLVALDALLDWLEHADRYEWVRVEADDAGALDDVVALRQDGRLVVRQVKFSTHPEAADAPWSWDVLLATSASKSGQPTKSLVQKWAASQVELRLAWNNVDAAVVSNRGLAADVRSVVQPNGYVDFSRLTPETLDVLIRQLGDTDAVRTFCTGVRFEVNWPNLDELEEGLRRRFARLGGTESGWLSLAREVRRWVIFRKEPPPDGHITLDHVRGAAQWRHLDALDQRFVVPDDYVLPSEAFHQRRIEQLRTLTSGQIVLTAHPGLGKSTYTSFIFRELRHLGVPVIRHHYFLSVMDRTSLQRLDHERAAEALMHDLAQFHRPALGELANRNPTPNPRELSAWLETCGRYYAGQGTALVVLVDGLDHVWRSLRSVTELDRLLGHILPAPEGVVVFLATQPVDDQKLPATLLRLVPRNEWLSLPSLDEGAVGRWLQHHQSDLVPAGAQPLPKHLFERIVHAFFERSGGHPLHLRYTLRALLARRMPITQENVRALPACADEDITKYYSTLWRELPEESRSILHLLAACTFPWPSDGVLSCLDPDEARLDELVRARAQVAHLLDEDALGLRTFHSSLLAFVGDLPEHAAYAIRLRQRALAWLRTLAPHHWRWAYEWLVAADLGDSAPLVTGPSRAWAVRALAERRQPEDIESILSASISYALQRQDLPRAVTLGLLREYAHTIPEYYSETWEALLYAQLRVAPVAERLPARLHAVRRDLTDGAVAQLAESDTLRGDATSTRQCLSELRDRWKHGRTRPASGTQATWRAQVEPLLRALALPGGSNAEDVIAVAVDNRPNGLTAGMAAMYAGWLRAYKNIGQLRAALGVALSSPTTPQVAAQTGDVAQGTDPNQAAQTMSGSSSPSGSRRHTRDRRSRARPANDTTDGTQELTLQEQEQAGIIRHAVLLAFEEGLDLGDALRHTSGAVTDPYLALYSSLVGLDGLQLGSVALPPVEWVALKRYEEYERAEDMREFFYAAFVALLACHLKRDEARASAWLGTVDSYTWARRFTHHLDGVARACADQLRAGTPLSIRWFYEHLSSCPVPENQTDFDDAARAYWRAATAAADELGLDLLCIAATRGGTPTITAAELDVVFASPYCDPPAWMRTYLSRRRPWMDTAAFDALLRYEAADLDGAIIPFPDRAARFGTLAAIAALHGRLEDADRHLVAAAENLLAHGPHKDLLFDSVLTAIERFQESGQAKANAGNAAQDGDGRATVWLLSLAPAIAHVTEFTDGDETRHLPRYLAEVLSSTAPDLLPTYYAWLCEREETDNALAVLHAYLHVADLSQPVARGIAATALDDRSWAILDERASGGDLGAATVLDDLMAVFGTRPTYVPADRAARPELTDANGSGTAPAVSPSAFDPRHLDEYLAALHVQGVWGRGDTLRDWVTYWCEQGQTQDVLLAVESAVERGIDVDCYDLIFERARRQNGKDAAYPWLVRAHMAAYGWYQYLSRREQTEQLWHSVKQLYAKKWFTFITDTIEQDKPWPGLTIGQGMIVRLVEYLLYMNQRDVAQQLIEHAVLAALELVSPVALPVPDWTVSR